MGTVGSRPAEDGAPIFVRDQNRFSISSVTITNSRNRVLFGIVPNAFPAGRYNIKRDGGDESAVEYIQDPEATSPQPTFLLRLANDDDLYFNFTFVVRQAAGSPPLDTNIAGLTYLFGSSMKDVENLAVREFHADPNLHKNPNVALVGDYTTSGSPSVQFSWTWKWKPPKQVEDKGSGWRNSASFVEYNQRAHRLDTLASFSFWVQNTARLHGSPKTSPMLEPGLAPRMRLPSAQSIESRITESDAGDGPAAPQLSPPLDAASENGLGLVPSLSGTTVATVTHAHKLDINCPKPGEDVSAVEDGPLFRATIKAMEDKTGTMKAHWKKVLKAAEAAQEAQVASNNAYSGLLLSLKEAASSSAVQPAIEHYFDKIAKEILEYERSNSTNIQKMIIDPISRLYNTDIKQVESKKRQFDEDSKDYYQYVTRYLGQRSDSLKEKKKAETDNKFENKRRNFELRRLDYSSFMQDLHGGRKDQEVLSQLTRYADAQARGYLSTAKKIEEMLPQLDALSLEVKEADKEYQLQRTEREERRRGLERSHKAPPDPSSAPALQISTSGQSQVPEPDLASKTQNGTPSSITSTPVQAATSAPIGMPHRQKMASPPSARVLGTSPGDRFKGIRDLEEKNYSGNLSADASGQPVRKEGLLWALSRPGSHVDPKGLNKQAWHKFWIVLDQGKLTEYQNWKQRLELHRDPIDLRVASVREARNQDRRFCFEVITPHFTRIYQATSDDDMNAWIAAINGASQSAVEGKNGPERVSTDSLPGSTRRDIAAVLTGKSSSMSSHLNRVGASKNIARHATVDGRPAHRSVEASEASMRLLRQIREADASNKTCADCGSSDKVDWVSINLGIIICIECSGIHRSLGTHISKVRSITLDQNVFTIDVVEVLLTIGNRISNMIWEAKLEPGQKPAPTATREQRLHFITKKYSERAFVQPISTTLSHFPNADDTLLTSIKKSDIQNVLYALALRANPNAADKSRGTHAVFLALAAADPAAPSGSATPTTSGSPSHSRSPSVNPGAVPIASPVPPSTRKPFPVAELLLLNGAELPALPAPIPLSANAKLYLEQKADQKAGRRAVVGPGGIPDGNGDGLSALPAIGGAGMQGRSGSLSEREARIQKRVSAAGRLVKSHGLPSG